MIRRLLSLGAALMVTTVIMAGFLAAFGYSPIQIAGLMIESAWLSSSGFHLLLTKASLLILTGLAVAIPYRAGLFNIGGEGQMLIGGLVAVVAGVSIPLPLGGWIVCLFAGCLAGALWGCVAADLKSRRGVHEVITTIMMNFMALHLVNECALNYFSGGQGTGRTALIAETAHLPVLWREGSSSTSWGMGMALLVAVGLSIWLYRTWTGFHLRAVGKNPEAAANSGISVPSIYRRAMWIGGGAAGLAGAIQTCGIDYTFYARFTGGYGFDGIAVAFLALNEPWAVIPASLGIATLRASDRLLQLETGIPKEMVLILEGIVIVSIAIFTRKRAHE